MQRGQLLVELQQRALCREHVELRAESGAVARGGQLPCACAAVARLPVDAICASSERAPAGVGDLAQRGDQRLVVRGDGEVVVGVAFRSWLRRPPPSKIGRLIAGPPCTSSDRA
jgi:hypothetical protein